MSTVLTIITQLFRVYEFLILIRVILSWVSPNSYHPAVQLLYRITEPVLAPLRRLIPPIGGTIDVSPVIALILLEIVNQVIVSLLIRL